MQIDFGEIMVGGLFSKVLPNLLNNSTNWPCLPN